MFIHRNDGDSHAAPFQILGGVQDSGMLDLADDNLRAFRLREDGAP